MSNFNYTFLDSDAGKAFKLTALYSTLPSISLNLFCKNLEISPGEDPIEESSPTGSFPAGTSDEAFAIIYHVDEDLYTKNDLDYLNNAAAIYMNNFYGTITKHNGKTEFTPSNEYTNKKYYGADSKGLYVLIPTNGSNSYSNDIIGDNYKVYVRGWCEVVDVGDLGGGNISLQMANGYYYNIENELYLFINTKLNLVNFSDNYDSFWYSNETEQNKKIFTNQSIYKSNGIYLKYANNGNPAKYQDGEDTMMIEGGVFDIIITPSMLTSISNFFGSSNAPILIISDELNEIGDYAFYGSNLSGWVSFSGESDVTSIGKYAFANTMNMDLFVETDEAGNESIVLPNSLVSIGEGAFSGSAGHGRNFDISKCTKLKSIGKKCFSNISNYKYFTYRRDQVEEDNIGNTALLYLPPDCMSYSLEHNLGSLKATGSRRLNQDPSTSYSSSLYDKVINLENSDVTETEKRNGLENLTFENAVLSGFTWICK